MEILIIFALAYGIMRSIHHGAVNTAAIVRGREPVYVPRRRPVAAAEAAAPAAGPGMGTAMTTAVVGGVGRGTSGVLAAGKDALVDGVRTGWGEGKSWYANRKAARAARRDDTGDQVAEAPELETTQVAPPSEVGSPEDAGDVDDELLDDLDVEFDTDQPQQHESGGTEQPAPGGSLNDVLQQMQEDITREREYKLAFERARTQAIEAEAHLATVSPGRPRPLALDRDLAQRSLDDIVASHPDTRSETNGGDEATGEPPRLRLVPDAPTDHTSETTLAAVDNQAGESGASVEDDEPAPAGADGAPATRVPAQRADTKGTTTMTTPMMSGETTTIDSTRAYLGELSGHVGTQILPQLELCQSTLQTADMDPTTLGHLTQAMEQFQVARSTLAAALDSLNSQHALMEEAVNNTQHAAERDYYKHQ